MSPGGQNVIHLYFSVRLHMNPSCWIEICNTSLREPKYEHWTLKIVNGSCPDILLFRCDTDNRIVQILSTVVKECTDSKPFSGILFFLNFHSSKRPHTCCIGDLKHCIIWFFPLHIIILCKLCMKLRILVSMSGKKQY